MPIGYDVEIISVGEMYIIPEDAYSIDITETGIYECLAGFNKGKEIDSKKQQNTKTNGIYLR